MKPINAGVKPRRGFGDASSYSADFSIRLSIATGSARTGRPVDNAIKTCAFGRVPSYGERTYKTETEREKEKERVREMGKITFSNL